MTLGNAPVNGTLLALKPFRVSGTVLEVPGFLVPQPYHHDSVEAEIRHVLEEMGPPHDLKQLAAAIDYPYKKFVRALKRSEGRDFLDVETVGRIAAYVTRHYKPTPPGWPIVTFEAHARAIQLIRESMEEALRPSRGRTTKQ